MKFERTPERLMVTLNPVDMYQLENNGIIGDRDGVFGFDSKITIRTPSDRFELSYLRRNLARITLDPGYDLNILLDPSWLPQNGFVHEAPRDTLLTPYHIASETDKCIPRGGVLLRLLPFIVGGPSVWTIVTDAETNNTEIFVDK